MAMLMKPKDKQARTVWTNSVAGQGKPEMEKEKLTRIEVPIAEPIEHVHCRKHINVNLNREQSVKMQRIVDGLDVSGARLASGRRVVTVATAVQWMIEQVKS